MSVQAAGATEDKETYVWEDLSVPRFEDGVAEEFGEVKPRGAQYEYAIAGTLYLDHLAHLSRSSANRVLLDRLIFQLGRSTALPEKESRQKLNRLLLQHGKEWKHFVRSLGAQSFVSQWTLREK